MNITKLLNHKKILFSLEIFPPRKDSSYQTIYNTLLKLRGLPVDFISVTYGAGGSVAQREKTVEIASLIRTTYHIEPVAHVTCVNSNEEEILELLDKLKDNQISNLMVLRGDITPGIEPKNVFLHASDLAAFIRKNAPSFNLVGACYPERHYQAETLDQDIENLKHKIDAGVDHLVTQLFFDNERFYEFMEKVRKAGISVPIEAGIMPITAPSQIDRIVSMCGASVPAKLAALFERYGNNPAAFRDAGIFYATEQIMDLIANNVQGIHLYSMNNVDTATRISDAIQNILIAENQTI